MAEKSQMENKRIFRLGKKVLCSTFTSKKKLATVGVLKLRRYSCVAAFALPFNGSSRVESSSSSGEGGRERGM